MEQNQSLHIDGLKCPIYSENDKRLLAFFSFWIEGILTSLVAVLGIFGNTIVSFIISNKEMRNSFNLLLVSLACFDSTYVSNFNYIMLLKTSHFTTQNLKFWYILDFMNYGQPDEGIHPNKLKNYII